MTKKAKWIEALASGKYKKHFVNLLKKDEPNCACALGVYLLAVEGKTVDWILQEDEAYAYKLLDDTIGPELTTAIYRVNDGAYTIGDDETILKRKDDTFGTVIKFIQDNMHE